MIRKVSHSSIKPTTKVKKLLCLIVYFSMPRKLEVNRNSRKIFVAKGHTDPFISGQGNLKDRRIHER
jgi:hypothetical protein